MFDDQLHQFIASSRTTSISNSNSHPLVNPLPLPLSSNFPLHHHNHVSPQTSNSFDSYTSHHHHHHQQLLVPLHQQQHLLHPILHHHKSISVVNTSSTIQVREKEEEEEGEELEQQAEVNNNNVDLDHQIGRAERAIMAEPNNGVDVEPWSNDEVLALLRIRSTMETWFPDFTNWEHVSRKLAELGFKMRSAEKCKEKFEEENRYFNNINNCTKNFRPFLSELEELYSHTTATTTTQQNPSHNHENNNNNNNDNTTIGPQKTHRPVEIMSSPSELARDTSVDHHQDKRGLEDHRHQIHDEIFGAKECSEKENQDQKVLSTETSKGNTNTNISKKRKRQSSSSSTSHHHHHQDHHHEKNSTKFEIFKGFCEGIVNKIMTQQEEMHNKLIEDMVKRDQEKLQKEEAWKKIEMDRMNQELEIMAREQAVAGDRQAAIIEFLRKFTATTSTTSPNSSSSNSDNQYPKPNQLVMKNTTSTSTPSSSPHHQVSLAPSSSSLIQSLPSDQNPNGSSLASLSTLSNMVAQHEQTQNPSSSQKKVTLQNPNDHQDLGKRWPRDEVLALINLRCSLYNNGDQQQQQQQEIVRSSEQSAKTVPLWERISQGMSEMGYKRSAKRCKEKWENINKYFRKTKDVNKKRSVDSRTCPYFHQLSNLYNKGTILHDDNHHHHHHDQDINNHDHHRLVGEGERSLDDHHDIITNTTSVGVGVGVGVGVVPGAFDFEF